METDDDPTFTLLFKLGLLFAALLICLAAYFSRKLVDTYYAPPIVHSKAPAKPKLVTVPEKGNGKLITVAGSVDAPKTAHRLVSVRVQIEQGLSEAIGVVPAKFADAVLATLNDDRSWGKGGKLGFARTDGAADVNVILATPVTSTALCRPMMTNGRLSCRTGDRAVLNAYRWMKATPEFSDLGIYRQYLVNHEVGHVLGNGHKTCPGAGLPAPVMQQQTKGVAPCVPNAWPYN